MGLPGLFFRLTENPRVGDSILSLITERAGHDPLVSYQVLGGQSQKICLSERLLMAGCCLSPMQPFGSANGRS